MDQILDLSVVLTPPPSGSPSNTIASIALRCDQLQIGHAGDLLTDPLTQMERDGLRWYLEEYWKWPYEQFRERAEEVENLLPLLGKRLYQAVFKSSDAQSILQAWRLQPVMQRQISIVSDVPSALSLPWELLHDEQGFLALRTRHSVSIVRCLPQGELEAPPIPFEPPLRVLLVTARPEGTSFVDPRGIARELVDEVQGEVEAGTITLEFLRPPTLRALRSRLNDLKRPPIHILHFDGHGAFDEEMDTKEGLRLSAGKWGGLAFENNTGQLDLVKAGLLAQVLQDSGIRLVVLTTSKSAMSTLDDAFSSVAAQLIRGGVNAVAAMGASVLIASATRYVEAFYHALAAGTSAQVAQERAVQALHDDPRRHVHRRRQDEEGKPVELRDWWLPQFYQQRPLELQPTRVTGSVWKQQVAQLPLRLNERMPAGPRYGFSGRAHELLQIERHLLHGKLVVIYGFGGIGKTAVAREAADWLTRTQLYAGACFVSFEYGGDATTLLSALGNFMGVYDGHYNPNDPKAALVKLGPVLKEKRTLVIADNLESILPNGDAPLEAAVRTSLWDVLLELAKLGTGVLLTTRDTSFGDGRLAPGSRTAHLLLQGLHPDDAYALASSLLDDLRIGRARAPYAEMRDLLAQLDYHPLSIQLVLPALQEIPLAKIRADFASLLPKFLDDTTMGRNRSLLASLDDSLRRLSEEQRALLPRLALFEGGAMESELLVITEIPEYEWAKLRMTLEQAALLTAEYVHEAISIPYLRFHPVLTPFLRGQRWADDLELRKRYTRRYNGLARYLYHEDSRNPQPVRALVRQELPNLRRALELLLEADELEDASDMANSIAKFLSYFGLQRERDELWHQMDEAIARADARKSGMLTQAEYLRESSLGEDENSRGNFHAAYTRFTALLAHIRSMPEGIPLGRGSYEHGMTLGRLARCLEAAGQPAAAESHLREALSVIDALVKRHPDDQNFISLHNALLTDLGDVLLDQGQYQQARSVYERALKGAKEQENLRSQAVVLGQLGTLALKQKDHTEARSRYTEALAIFRALDEPTMEASAWHQLGLVAQEQQEWVEAEHYYRESLVLREQLGNVVGAAKTCNQLAIIAQRSGRPAEAEGWYKRALELEERMSGSPSYAGILNNLAYLLLTEVQAERASVIRLAEARSYAERYCILA